MVLTLIDNKLNYKKKLKVRINSAVQAASFWGIKSLSQIQGKALVGLSCSF